MEGTASYLMKFLDGSQETLHMADTKTFQPDYKAAAKQAYEWLKKRRAKGVISTSEAVMKATGLKWKDIDNDEFLNKSGDALLRLIKKEKKYVADFSVSEGMIIGQPWAIPFIFRKR